MLGGDKGCAALTEKRTLLPRKFSRGSVSASYSKVARFYGLWSLLTESKAARRVLTLADIQDGESVIEVAVGTGAMFADVARHNPHGVNEGVDLTSAMLEVAAKHLSDVSAVHLDLVQASAYDLPYPADTFDVLLNSYMLDMLPEEDFVTVLAEYRRVIKPDGRVVIATFGFGSKFYHSFWYWLARHFPALLTGCRPVSLQHSLAAVGFRIIRKEQVSQNTFPSTILSAEVLR
jgi:ubiquinone/menaquinone biosynthesis C-methylase UbiE